jgi:hypothetical protein
MRTGALPSLKNPVLEALYRRIRSLEESLPPVCVARSAEPTGRDDPSRAAAAQRTLPGARAGEDGPASPKPAGPFEGRVGLPHRAAAGTGT